MKRIHPLHLHIRHFNCYCFHLPKKKEIHIIVISLIFITVVKYVDNTNVFILFADLAPREMVFNTACYAFLAPGRAILASPLVDANTKFARRALRLVKWWVGLPVTRFSVEWVISGLLLLLEWSVSLESPRDFINICRIISISAAVEHFGSLYRLYLSSTCILSFLQVEGTITQQFLMKSGVTYACYYPIS